MKITGKTDIGAVRSKNEDAFDYGVLPDGTSWAIVCDGMGGVHGGKIASAAAIEMVSDKIKKCYNPSMSVTSLENLLLSSITTANVNVFDRGVYDSSLKGMGTTIVAALIKNNEVCIAHVGDSRAYIVSDSLFQVTTDHSVVQNMIEKGEIPAEEAVDHPSKHIITRALGVDDFIKVDFCQEMFGEDEILLLCSDGLTNYSTSDDILRLTSDGCYYKYADRLVNLANQNGGGDNITVVLAAY